MFAKDRDEYRSSRFWVIIEAALEYFISILTTGAYLARITKELGFSDSLTGILSAFVSLGCVFQLGSSLVFKGVKRVKGRVILFQMIYEALFVIVYITPVMNGAKSLRTAIFLICFVSCYTLINLIRSEKTNWHLRLLDYNKRGIFGAKKEIVSLIGGMTFTYVMGSLIDGMESSGNTKGAFIVCGIAVFALTALHGVSLILIREKPQEQRADDAGIKSMPAIAKNGHVMKAIMVGVLWSVASYASTPFYGVYQIQELKFSMRFISILGIVYGIVRSLVSPFAGRYADRHSFAKLLYLCFFLAAAGFGVNMFTRPENGKWMFLLYNVFSAVSMAGINNSLVNIVYDFAPSNRRTDAIAFYYVFSGVAGFATTCLSGMAVSAIQNNANRVFGIGIYPAQFVSGISLMICIGLIVYVKAVVLKSEEKGA